MVEVETVMLAPAPTEAASPKSYSPHSVLNLAATSWFVVAIIGQWIFSAYIISFYGGAALAGDWDRVNKVLPHGYAAGNAIGNSALAVHLLFAAIISFSGALQLVPKMRARFLRFHRWNGRVYLLLAFVMSLTGLYLSLSGRKVVGDVSQHIGIEINAVLIIVCAGMAWRSAVIRDFNAHRRWALRLFLATSGVWFFRVGLMFWLMVNGAPVGFDPKTFQGPYLTFLAFGQYLLPLVALEFYLRAESSRGALPKFVMAAGLFALTAMTGLGITGATMAMWLPRLR